MGGSIGVIASDLIKIVGKSAPVLARALGSPLAGTALALLSSAFGVSPDNLAATIAADPEAELKLKTLEYQHAEELARIDAGDFQVATADSQNARANFGHDHVAMFLAILFSMIYAGIQFAALYNPSTQDDVISARVQDILLMIISFYFGRTAPRTDPQK